MDLHHTAVCTLVDTLLQVDIGKVMSKYSGLDIISRFYWPLILEVPPPAGGVEIPLGLLLLVA